MRETGEQRQHWETGNISKHIFYSWETGEQPPWEGFTNEFDQEMPQSKSTVLHHEEETQKTDEQINARIELKLNNYSLFLSRMRNDETQVVYRFIKIKRYVMVSFTTLRT